MIELLGISEVSAATGVKPWTLREMARRGVVECCHVKGRRGVYLFPATALDAIRTAAQERRKGSEQE